ncbi:hypothetical protein ZIOFF_013823 [Zingiber officinale]|uniref:Protein kinase domain-containing protein n=1 Tax=Zingiber officinale TaxID=94328 RepID=A0A8J5LP37_ZINOF|nr:hypothetical protein ZIOFF_013823 [Zingiber officinale]
MSSGAMNKACISGDLSSIPKFPHIEIDPRHRYGHNLQFYYDVWFKNESTQPFFYWLDVGDGREINLEKCPRSKLQNQCIKYLGQILHQIEIGDEDEESESSDSKSNDDLELSKVTEMRLLPSDAGKCSFLFLQMTTPISIEDVRREVKILKALSNHNNLVKFYDACEDALNIYVVMEFCEGEELLERILSRGGRYSEEDAKAIVIQILSVIAFCHLQGVVHRDLKPKEQLRNFLFTTRDENAQMKLIDFGLSDFVKPVVQQTYKQRFPGKQFCTPSYSIHQNLEALSKALTEDQLFYLRSQFKLLAPNGEGHISFDNFRMALLQNATESMKESKVIDILNVMRHPFLLPFFLQLLSFFCMPPPLPLLQNLYAVVLTYLSTHISLNLQISSTPELKLMKCGSSGLNAC